MSSFRKALTAMAGLLVLLLTTPSLFGQPTGSYWGPLNKSELYGALGVTRHSRGISRQEPLSIRDPKCCTSLTLV